MVDGGTAVISIVGDATGLNKTVDSIGAKVSAAATSIAAIGVIVSAVMISAVAETFKFGKAMAEVSTLGVDDIGELEEGVKDLALAYGVDLKDTAVGAYEVISRSTKDATEATEILEFAVRASIAGVADLNDVVILGTGVVSAFSDKNLDFERVMDLVQIAINNGGTNMREMAGQVSKATPVFSALGLSAEELLSIIAAVTVQGTDTRKSITGITQAVNNILKPTEDATRLASLLEIEFSAQQATVQGLIPFLGGLKDAVDSQVPALIAEKKELLEKQKTLQTAADQIQKNIAWQDAYGETTQASTVWLEQITKAQKQNNIHLDATNARLEQLGPIGSNATDTLAMFFGSSEAGTSVLQVLSEKGVDTFNLSMEQAASGVKFATKAIDDFQANNPAKTFDKMTTAVDVLQSEIGANLLVNLDKLFQAIIDGIEVYREWRDGNEGLNQTIASWVVILAGAALAIGTVTAAVLLLKPIIVAIGAAIAFLVVGPGAPFAAFVALMVIIGLKAFEIGKTIGDNWDLIKDITRDTWQQIKDGLSDIWDKITFVFVDGPAQIIGSIEGLWDTIKDLFGKGIDFVVESFQKLWDKTVEIWEGIKNAILHPLDTLKAGLDKAGALFKKLWGASEWIDGFEKLESEADKHFTGFRDGIVTNLDSATENLNAFSDNLRTVRGEIREESEGLVDDQTAITKKQLEASIAAQEKSVKELEKRFRAANAEEREFAKVQLENAKDNLKKIKKELAALVSGGSSGRTTGGDTLDTAGEAVEEVFDDVSDAVDDVADSVDNVADSVEEFSRLTKRELIELRRDADAFGQSFDIIGSTARRELSTVESAVASVGDAFTGIGNRAERSATVSLISFLRTAEQINNALINVEFNAAAFEKTVFGLSDVSRPIQIAEDALSGVNRTRGGFVAGDVDEGTTVTSINVPGDVDKGTTVTPINVAGDAPLVGGDVIVNLDGGTFGDGITVELINEFLEQLRRDKNTKQFAGVSF